MNPLKESSGLYAQMLPFESVFPRSSNDVILLSVTLYDLQMASSELGMKQQLSRKEWPAKSMPITLRPRKLIFVASCSLVKTSSIVSNTIVPLVVPCLCNEPIEELAARALVRICSKYKLLPLGALVVFEVNAKERVLK